jgi:hypothetical protein
LSLASLKLGLHVCTWNLYTTLTLCYACTYAWDRVFETLDTEWQGQRKLGRQGETITHRQCEKEPLSQMTWQEQGIWANTIKASAVYRPKEAAEHAQRLQAYVASAADRAAGQLEPGLKKELYEALGLAL